MLRQLIEQYEDLAYQSGLFKDDVAISRARAFTQAAEMARNYVLCDKCNGTRLVTILNYDGHGSDADDQPCLECAQYYKGDRL